MLKMAQTNATQWILSWPADSSGFVLESSLVVHDTNRWTMVTNTAVVSGNDLTVRLPRQTTPCFSA